MTTWLQNILGPKLHGNGALASPRRIAVDVLGENITVADNPSTGRTEITVGVSAAQQIQRLPLIANTFGLWQFDGDLLDSSGNNFHLTGQDPGSGVKNRFSDMRPGFRAFSPDGGSWRGAYHNALAPGLRQLGDMTLQWIGTVRKGAQLDRCFVTHMKSGSTEADNILYQAFYANGSAASQVGWRSEDGSGNESNYYPGYNGGLSPAASHIVPLFEDEIFMFGAVREGNMMTFYTNGVAHPGPSLAFPTPTGGTAGKFYVMTDDTGATLAGSIASLRGLSVARSPASMLADYNAAMGQVFGIRT